MHLIPCHPSVLFAVHVMFQRSIVKVMSVFCVGAFPLEYELADNEAQYKSYDQVYNWRNGGRRWILNHCRMGWGRGHSVGNCQLTQTHSFLLRHPHQTSSSDAMWKESSHQVNIFKHIVHQDNKSSGLYFSKVQPPIVLPTFWPIF